jgi:hypothetical protein
MFPRTGSHRSPSLFLAVALFMLCACYAHDPSRTTPLGRTGVGDVVARTELVASGASSLYDALVRTRRQFFVGRGATSLANQPADAILVFHAGMLWGTTDVLRTLQASDVRVVRRIGVTETFQRYGRFVSVAGLEVELVNDV